MNFVSLPCRGRGRGGGDRSIHDKIRVPMKIALLAALAEEYAPFKRMTGPWRLICRKPFKTFESRFDGKTVFLIETGMGDLHAEKALTWVLEREPPDLIVSGGFAGSLTDEFQVGQVVVGRVFHSIVAEEPCARQSILDVHLPAGLTGICDLHGVAAARILTAAGPVNKCLLGAQFQDVPSVVDMETYSLARFACMRAIPFLSVRAVSDGLHDDIGFDLGAITGPAGEVRLSKVFSLAVRKPLVIKAFYVSWIRSAKAGKRMGEFLRAVLRLSVTDLGRMISECIPKGGG